MATLLLFRIRIAHAGVSGNVERKFGGCTDAGYRETELKKTSNILPGQSRNRGVQAGTKVSMDGKGRALDNVFVERLWRTVRYEDIYLKDYRSPRDATLGPSILQL
ncbi:MAG: hypothetical protein JW863_16955 [Chitinispirillaceae bacterium]|nr:hypothetical protein [Chitinispirillaceae bacterium]